MGQPLCCSAVNAGLWGERGYGGGPTPCAWLSSISLLPWLPGFPPQAFPTTISCLTSPPSISPQSTAALRPGIAPQSLNSGSQLLHLQETCVPVWGTCGGGKDCLILIPFMLPQVSCFTLSLKCLSSDSDNCPDVGIGPLLQFPHLPRAGPALLTLPFPHLVPSSYRVPRGSIYSFPLVRSSYPLSCCSACTSVSEGVFLMYPWREMYATSSCSSAILFSLQMFLNEAVCF